MVKTQHALVMLAMLAGVQGATHALHLTADGDVWEFPSGQGKRMFRHHDVHEASLQDRQDPETVKILSNNTARLDDFLRGMKEDAAVANLGVAMGLVAPLLCVMALFYMVNQSISEDLVTSTWQLLSGNIALFGTVITFMALKKCWKLIVGSQAEELARVGDTLAFLKFLVLLIGIPLLRAKLEKMAATRWLQVLRTTGAYLIGFAGADSFANFLRVQPFSSGAGYYFLGMTMVCLILGGLLELAIRISDYGRPSGSPYEPDREAEQVDAIGFQIGFLMSMWIRFLVTGFLPGSKKEAHPLNTSDLSYLGLALLLSMAVFALMMWKVRAMADNTERKPSFRRIFRILTESSAMTMAWLLMYWVQWLFWYFHQNADGSHRSGRHAALMSQAIASTVLVYAGLMGLVFVAKRMEKKVSDFTELCNAFVLQTGFCWEMAIYVGLVDSFTAKMANPTGRRVAAIVWICFLLVMIAPAWFWYILPKSQKGADAKSEGDATVKDKENDAPKEAAPAAAAPAESTPAAAAEPTPAAPAAEETPAPPTTEEPKVETPAEEAS
mgnify:CR=1 FL=1